MTVRTLTDQKPELGTPIEAIETPALLVDIDTMEQNIREYAKWASDHGVNLRSHVKTHKNPDIGHLQNKMTDYGGIMCQTLGEVEVMAYNGHNDIYLSYMVVDKNKCERFAHLSEKIDQLATTVDSPGNVDPIQTAAAKRDIIIDVFLEIDTGLNRVGVPQGKPAVELAEYIVQQPNVNLAGILAYESQIKTQADGDKEELKRLAKNVMDETQKTVAMIEDAGIRVEEVKTGGTVTSKFSGKHPVVDEINPGMYPFNDAREMHYRPWDVDKRDVALTVLTSAISVSNDNRVIFDAGSKSISLESNTEPIAMNYDNLHYYNASEEHGWVDTNKTDESFEVGDKVKFIPPHVCPTINLHETIVGVRDEHVEEVWDVAARGKVK
jgi:D-serine deaminase-like pyridoxal phosphate-dependent protein